MFKLAIRLLVIMWNIIVSQPMVSFILYYSVVRIVSGSEWKSKFFVLVCLFVCLFLFLFVNRNEKFILIFPKKLSSEMEILNVSLSKGLTKKFKDEWMNENIHINIFSKHINRYIFISSDQCFFIFVGI